MTKVRIGRRLTLGACLGLALVVVLGGAASSFRKIESFQPIGFSAEQVSGHWHVSQADGSTGVVAGDEILLVNGESFARVAGLEQALRSHAESELVLMRAGELQTVGYSLPALDIDVAYLVLALIGCAYLLIGFYTLLRDQRGPALVFFLWTVTSAIVYLFTVRPPFDLLDKALYVGEEFARVLLAPLTLHLFTIFPRPIGRRQGFRWAIPFLYLPAAFLLLLQIDLLATGGQWLFGSTAPAALAVLDRLELLHLVFFGLAAAGVLGWRLWKTRQLEARRQTTWIALGLLLGYAPFALLYVLPRTLGASWPDTLAPLTVLFLAIVPVTFCYAILRHRLWDLGILARDSASLALTVLIGVSGFALANLMVNRLVPENLALGRNLLVFVSGITIAGLMVPTRRGLGQSLERLQYRGRFGRRRALAELGNELLTERDLDRLCQRLSEEVESSLEIAPTNVLLRHDGVLAAWRADTGLEETLALDELPVNLWQAPVHSIPALAMPEENPAELALFTGGYRYLFPLTVRGNGVGIFVCGYKEGGVPLNSDDVDLVRSLLNQTALAIENAQLLQQVRTQLEEVGRLRNLNNEIVESSPAGIAVLDESDRILSANRAFADLARQEIGALAGRPLLEVLPMGSLPRRGEGLRETSYRTADGDERYVQVSAGDLADPSQPGNRVLVVQDVSQRVAMETALKEKDRLASLGVLAAGVAHEVNTPITGISSYAQMLLASTPEGDPRRQLLEKVETQTFRAARIVNNLLNFARKREGEYERLDLVPLVGECLELLRERMVDKNVALTWRPPAEPIRIAGNEGELQQVFTNLVINAIDAMTSGGALEVDLETDQRWVWVGIQDTGPGIPIEELENVFEPFYSTKHAQGGTGLGLSISHDLIKRHGGDIRVISAPGEGCRFVVELPLAEAVRAQ